MFKPIVAASWIVMLLGTQGLADSRIFEKTIAKLQTELNNGTLTSEALTQYYLQRIKVYNGSINAMITVNPHALQEERASDAARTRGATSGPLTGIPVVLKDNYNTRDMKTTSETLAFKDVKPAEDAFTVAKIRKAGAVIIGKAI